MITDNEKGLYSARYGKKSEIVIGTSLTQARSRLFTLLFERFLCDPDQTRDVCILPTYF